MAVNPTLMHGFSSRASPPNTKRPRDHRACTNVAQFHFQDSYTRASSNTFSEAAPPQSRTHVSRVTAPTHHYLTQTRAPASATRLDTVAQASTGCSSTRPRPRRQASPASHRRHAPRDAADRSRQTSLVAAAPAVVISQQRPMTPLWRAREWPKASPAFTSNDRPFCGCASTAYRVTRAARPAALSSQRLQQCVVAAEAARRRGQL